LIGDDGGGGVLLVVLLDCVHGSRRRRHWTPQCTSFHRTTTGGVGVMVMVTMTAGSATVSPIVV
jgi:hypothetical protein